MPLHFCNWEDSFFLGYVIHLFTQLRVFSPFELKVFLHVCLEIPLVLFDLIADAKLTDLNNHGLSEVLVDLLQIVLTKNPAERAGLGDCLKHAFCASAREQRIRELGDEIEKHDEKIIPQHHDLRQVGCVGGLVEVLQLILNTIFFDSSSSDRLCL
jgi:hypothetical protein